MKLRHTLLTLLCTLALLCSVVPPVAAKAPGGDFAWTDSKQPLLIEQILQRDGLIDGIWFPWFDGGNVGHSLTGNEVMVRYYGNNWSKVAMDTVGADKIYHEIYNLKAMGYNLLGYGGSIYDEGVVFDAYGDVIGVKQEFLDNARRLLDMCREIGMPVMWTICFHSSSAPNYYGMDAWNIFSQKYVNPTVAKHYAERFARPVCEMLAEYPDVVALVAITDEIENEINDSEEGNHFDNARATYGVTEADMVYFMKEVTKVAREELPNTALTMASNDMNKAMYNGFDMDLMGHNRYDNNANLPTVEEYFSDAPMIMTEYNIGGDGKFTAEQYAQRLITYREKMMSYGYKGGIQWAWMHNGRHASTSYYLLDSVAPSGQPNTDFIETVALLRHYIDDYRAEYQGKTVVLDKPVLYCNEGGGYVEWIPSRQAEKMDILRSTDGGKTWTTVLSNANQADYVDKGKGRYKDAATANSMYKIVVRDGKGNTAESEPGNVAGVSAKYKKATTTVKLDGSINIGKDYSTQGSYTLYNFGVAQNRPYNQSVNLIKNGSFESTTDAQWNTSSFMGSGVSVVTDKTAPEGSKTLYFNTSGNTTEQWYTFTVPVEKNTNYVFSAWVKGSYLSATNSGHASIGVVDPTTGKFMIYPSYRTRCSRANRQVYPTAWDEEWHLRSVAFNSADLTQVTIALCGENTQMWVDGMALYQNGNGVKYVGERNASNLIVDMDAEALVCKDSACLTTNSGFADGNRYWSTGHGWRNGYLSVTSDDKIHGKVLHYTGTNDGYGTYYTMWVDVKPNTDYSFAFDVKILKNGSGKLAILDDAMSSPRVLLGFEFDKDIYGSDWGSYYIKFNTGVYTRIGISVCNLGGEALMDNLRLFKSSDGKEPENGGTVATIAPQATTTTKTPTTPSTTERPADVTPPADGGDVTESTLAPTVTETVTDTVATTIGTVAHGTTTTKAAVAATTTTAVREKEKVLLSMLTFKDNYLIPGIIFYVTLAAVIATAVLTAVILMRKHKKAPTDTPNE